jgi:hypothetical protein
VVLQLFARDYVLDADLDSPKDLRHTQRMAGAPLYESVSAAQFVFVVVAFVSLAMAAVVL